ncbi:MAG: DUF3486 family protein [Alphaproteobacteria bacterium]|nr:DUF3486 family protein [Alphaproteobacteria bacterium]
MGRKSRVDALPAHVKQAIEFELQESGKTFEDLAQWLADEHGFEISKSSLHRWAKREAKTREALKRQREVTAAFAKELGPEAVDGKQGRLLVEMFNGLVFDLISSKMAAGDDEEEEAGFDTKDFMQLGRALKDVAQANRFSQDFEEKLRARIRDEEKAAAADSAAEAMTEAGLTKDQVRFWREEFLGVKRARSSPDGSA